MRSFFLNLAAVAARILPTSIKSSFYRIRPLARLIRGGLNRAAPKGLVQVQVAAGGAAGLTLLLDLQTEKDYWLGTYEIELQETIKELVKPGAVVYDVGANIGYISLLFAQAVGPSGQVFAFEALPANQERLRTNLELNRLTSIVELYPGAVVEKSREVRFLIGPSGGMGKADGSAGRQEIAYPESLVVPGISLDDFVFAQGNPPPQVVKMDIEGGEVLALPGMRQVLAQARPLVLMELHGLEAARAAWDCLSTAGYCLCQMAPGYPKVEDEASLDWKAYLVAFPGRERPE